MALDNEYMLEELTAEEIYQKKLIAGTNITINPITNTISAAGGGSSVQYSSNYPSGDVLGNLTINGTSNPIRTPNLVAGTNMHITQNAQTGSLTFSADGGGDLTAHELTQEEYDVLTPAQKQNGELYLTHPATQGSNEPNKIYYNNSLYAVSEGEIEFFKVTGHFKTLQSGVVDPDTIVLDCTLEDIVNAYQDNKFVYLQTYLPAQSTAPGGIGEGRPVNCILSYIERIMFSPLGGGDPIPYWVFIFSSMELFYSASSPGTGNHSFYQLKYTDGNTGYPEASLSAFNELFVRRVYGDSLPDVDSTDTGKVLTVDSNGEWAADDAPETVIPNPQGTPTVDLSTVQIGNTIYDIVSGNEVIELTQAEWDALPSSKLTDGIIYVITDGSGGGGGSDNHAIHVPPVIYENGVLKKIANFNEFPGIEKVYLTTTEYNNLTEAQKGDLSKIYYVSNYEFITNEDDTLVLRIDSSNNALLYFVGVELENSNPLTMPSEIATYIGNRYPDSYGYYDPSDTSSVDCYINCNWSGDNTKYWVQDGRHSGTVITNTPVYGVLNPAEGYGQELVYSNPWNIQGGFTIYYGGKQYTDFELPSGLPDVTSADNGKILKVVSGEWNKADAPREVPVIGLGDNDKVLTVESGAAAWVSPKKMTQLYDVIPMENPLYRISDITTDVSPLTIDMTQITSNYSDLRATDFEYVFMNGDAISRPWGYNPIDNTPGTFEYNPSTGSLIATLRGGFNTATKFGIVYKKSIIQLTENATISGQSGTIDCSEIPSADTLTINDFAIVITNVMEYQTSNTGAIGISPSLSYNQSTMQLSWSVSASSYNHLTADGYVIVGNYGDPEYKLITDFTGATASTDGYRGFVPAPLSADRNKFLKGDGTWNTINANSVQVPPVMYNNGDLMKMTVEDFPGLTKVFLSAQEYAALTTAQKQDLSKIYYISQYKYFNNEDDTLTVRVDGNNTATWIFFNGWTYDPNAETNIPAAAAEYCTSIGNSYGYSDAESTTRPVVSQPCWVRFNGTKATCEYASEYQVVTLNRWYPDTAGLRLSPVYGKLKIGEVNGSYAYSDPYDTGETIFIYYGGKQYTEFDFPSQLPTVTSSDEGKVLKVNSSGNWVAGNEDSGLEVVKLSQTAYDSLTDAQKKNGKMYLIDASIFTGGIPRVSGEDSKITASSGPNAYAPWKAFDGNDHTPGQDNDGWTPNNGDDQWIKYQFASSTPINKIWFKAVSRNTSSWSGTIYIEGSNDDTTWENILKNKLSITTELPARSSSSVEFNEDANGESYTYIRLRIGNQSYQKFQLSEFDADITTLTYDSIYYMGRQYSTMEPELPAATASDSGKILSVDSSGDYQLSNPTNAISNLTDVNLTNLADGNILKYDATNQEWINDTESSGNETELILNAQIYSADEKQVGVWTNGKPLYQKTVEITNPQTVSGLGGYDVTLLNIDECIDIEGYAVTNQNLFLPLTYCTPVESPDVDYNLTFYSKPNEYIMFYLSQLVSGGFTKVATTIKYTKTTDSAGSGGYQAYGFTPVIYSTTEREVGVWTDNRPIYQKTILYPNTINSNTFTTIDNTITTSTIDNIFLQDIDWTYSSYIVGGQNTGNSGLSLTLTSNGLSLENQTPVAGSNFAVTIRYTKIGDTAGSGKYNTLGVPTVHYNSNEKVIGTWFGETLYEKTVWFTSVTNKSWNNVFIANNIQKQIDVEGYWDLNSDGTSIRLPLEYLNGSDKATFIYSKDDISSYDYVGVYPYFNGFDNRINGVMLTVKYTKTTD